MRTRSPAGAGLHERDHELERIVQLVADCCAGSGGALLVEGGAGAGKSALMAAAGERAEGDGVRILRARCVREEQQLSGGVIRRLLGADAPPVSELDALLDRISARPTLLLIDDLHWADADSARLAAFAAARAAERGVSVLAAASPAHGAVASDGWGRLRLAPLSIQAGCALLAARVPGADAGRQRMCAEAAAGNPFVLVALADALAAADGDGVPLLDGPELRAWLSAQLAALAPGAPRMALAAAVLGPDARLLDVAALAGLDDNGLDDSRDDDTAGALLDRLVASELIVVDPDFVLGFAQPALRTALLAAAGPGHRSRLHAHAARRLVARGAPAARVAAQLMHTAPAGDPSAVAALCQAATEASDAGMPTRAAELLRRAADEPPPPARRVEVLRQLGHALVHVDLSAALEVLNDAVEQAHPGEPRALAAEDLGHVLHLHAGRPAAALTAFAQARAELGDAHPRAAELRGHELSARRDAHDSEGEPAPAAPAPFAAGTADPLLLVETALEEVIAGRGRGTAAAAARGVAHARVAPATALAGAFTAAHVLLWCGHYRESRQILEEILAVADRRQAHRTVLTATFCRARVHLRAGRVADALADGRAVLAAERSGWDQWMVVNRAWLARALIEAERPEEAREVLRPTDDDRRWYESSEASFRTAALARLALVAGDPAGSAELYLRLGAELEAAGCLNPAVIAWRSGAAEALLATGAGREAMALLDAEEAALHEFGGPADALARVWRIRAALTPRAPLPALERAAQLARAGEGGLELCECLLALGAALSAGSERQAAVATLRSALARGAELDHVAVARRARRALNGLGVRPRRAAQRGPQALTPSEFHVARFAARGWTNRRIGAELHVSPRTVEHHLTSIFRKLTIARREQLPEALGENRPGAETPGGD